MALTNKIIRIVAFFTMIAVLCFAFYEVGKSNGQKEAKIQIIEKEVEVIRYVAEERAKIQSAPNAGRNELLELLHDGKL